MYKHLVEVQENNYSLQNIYEGWNKDLNITNSDSIWKQCLSTTNTITTNENLRLIQYKLMTRIYYTRSKINTFDASFSPVCVKCGIYKETIIHAFWECEKVRKGWLEIQKWMTTTCRIKFEFTVMRCIFQNTDTLKYPIGWMVIFSSLVYKKLILKDWKGSEAPSLQLWKGLMKYYLSIERSMFEDRNRRRQFNKVWQDLYEAL